ncbi:MAG TPA: glycosyltransferase [Candidatus Xenobia bacterium]
MPELSALILTYHEGPTIAGVVEKVLAALRQLDPQAEVVVVDGGSDDGTQENARAAGALVCQQREKGYGAAFKEGLQYVTSEYVATLDADLSHDPELLMGMWARRHDADLVVYSRYIQGGSAELSRFRTGLSHFMNGTYRWVLGMPVLDMSSGYRLYRREPFARISLQGRFFDILVEILIKGFNQGLSILEIPFHFEPRLHGESHLNVVRAGMGYAQTLWRLFWLRHGRQAVDWDVQARRSLQPARRWWTLRRAIELEKLRPSEGLVLDLGGVAAAVGVRAERLVVADTRTGRLALFPGRCRVQVDPYRLPFEDRSVPLVVLGADAFASPVALAEIRRVLTPNGVLAVAAEMVPELSTNGAKLEKRDTISVQRMAEEGGAPQAESVRCPRCRGPLRWAFEGEPPACGTCGWQVPQRTWGWDFS